MCLTVGDNGVKVLLILYMIYGWKWGIFGFCVDGVVDGRLGSWWDKSLLSWWFVVGLRGWLVILGLRYGLDFYGR